MEQFIVGQIPEPGVLLVVSMDAIAIAKLVSLSEEAETRTRVPCGSVDKVGEKVN